MENEQLVSFGKVKLLDHAVDMMIEFQSQGLRFHSEMDFKNGGIILMTVKGSKGKATKVAKELFKNVFKVI